MDVPAPTVEAVQCILAGGAVQFTFHDEAVVNQAFTQKHRKTGPHIRTFRLLLEDIYKWGAVEPLASARGFLHYGEGVVCVWCTRTRWERSAQIALSSNTACLVIANLGMQSAYCNGSQAIVAAALKEL